MTVCKASLRFINQFGTSSDRIKDYRKNALNDMKQNISYKKRDVYRTSLNEINLEKQCANGRYKELRDSVQNRSDSGRDPYSRKPAEDRSDEHQKSYDLDRSVHKSENIAQ